MSNRAASAIRLLATALLLSGVILEGQSTSGSILGLVSDPSRGLVTEAEVNIQNEGTGLTRKVRTNAEGTFLVPSLPPGMYRVTVKKSGFKTLTREGLLLAVDQKLSLDLALSVGDVAETVSVSGAAPVLQTQSVETGQVIGSRQILDLPLLGRNFLDLTLLIPGVAAGGGGNGANYSVNGQREFANSIVVNGIEITGNRNNDNSISPSVDAVEEFKAVTSGYAPEFGRAAGGVIAVQIKSGTNGFHGSAYEFLRTNTTTARTFFAPEPSQLKQHNFGASLGGPIIRNKTFFFASYEGFRVRDVFSYFDTTVPSGMISYLPDGGVDLSRLRDPNTGNQIPIFDPDFYNTNYYSQQFEGNIIPASRVSPAGRNILQKLFPAPNAPGVANGWFSNYSVEQRYKDNSTSGDMRLDHIFSSNDRISATYDVGDGDSQTGDRFAGAIPIAGGGSTDGADKTHSRTDVAGITYTRVMSPSQVNELRVSYLHTDLRQDDLLFGSNLADKLGIGNVNVSGFPATSGFPQIFLGFGASTGGSTYKPLTFSDQNVQVTDNYSWIRGQHALKFGYDFRRLVANPNFAVFPTGYQYYYGAYSSLTSDPTYGFYDPSAYYGNGGNEIADLLLGLPGAVVEGLQLTNAQSRSYEHHFYVQDVWQVNPKLVLTYGVRYEYQAPYTEAHNRASNFDIATKSMLLAGKGGHLDSLLQPDKNNFAPRLGIAWRAMPKTSVRAGWGFFYTPENDGRSDVLAHNFPFFTEQQYLNSPGSPYSYTLDQGVPRPTSIPVPPGASSIDLTKIPDAKVESVFVADTNFRTGYSQMADFMVEQELTSHFTVEAGYVGAFARKLPYAIGNVNRQNRISDLLGNIEGQFPIGNSNYHSLQLKLDKRFSSGFSFLASYTFSKSIDNGPAPFNLGPRTQQWPQDPFNLTLERALSASDLTHNFVFSGIWEVPIARNSHGFRRAAFGGWQLNTILVMHSGLPVNVIRNSRAPGGYEGLRPNLVANPNLSGDDQTLKHYFNTAAFSTTGLGPTDIGTAGRNLVRAPGLINCDLSLFKDLPLREKLVLQVRIEAFNVSNTPHFGAPSGDMSQGDFGAINGTSGIPRIMQFAAKLKF